MSINPVPRIFFILLEHASRIDSSSRSASGSGFDIPKNLVDPDPVEPEPNADDSY
jgi:hypothetical protein